MVTAIAFCLSLAAGLYLYSSTINSIRTTIQADLQTRTERVTDQVANGVLVRIHQKDPIFGHDQELIQVFGSSGQLMYSTITARSPLIVPRKMILGSGVNPYFLQVNRAGDGGEYLVLLQRSQEFQGGFVILTGESLDQLNDSKRHLGIFLLIGIPVTTILSGLGAFLLARRALRPVEQLRREAESLLGRSPNGRLKAPDTKDELAALAKTLNNFLASIETLVEKQRLFVASASHELRTPLARISADLELARQPHRDPALVAQLIDNASIAVLDLAHVCDGLLDLASGQDEHLKLSPKRVVFGTVLVRILEQFQNEASELGIDIVLDIDDSILVNLDAVRFARAVENVVENSLRFCSPGKAIFVSLFRSRTEVILRIEDQGPGFPLDAMAQLFTKELRERPVRKLGHSPHAGIGLVIASLIVIGHGGRITAHNAISGGAVIEMFLPIQV